MAGKPPLIIPFSVMEQMTGSGICCECATHYPMWEWAKRKTTCPVCIDRPSKEDLDGIRRDHTPGDWSPKN